MALCAVWEMPDGSIRVTRPHARVPWPDETGEAFRARLALESDRAYALRCFTTTGQKIEELQGLTFVVLDDATLPADYSTRDRWRLKRGRVVVEQLKEQNPRERSRTSSGL